MVLYWLIMIVLLAMFFTNDFGIVDIHKSLIVTALGIDVEQDEVQVTAQLAVPQPSQSGDKVQYVAVQGSGSTFADALNEINSKAGFYPKLLFCKLILLGESCKDENIFELIDSLYRKNYSELTANIAACEGKAADIMSLPIPVSDVNQMSVVRVLTEELKNTANVALANLKDVAGCEYSKAGACHMPYVRMLKPVTSKSGGKDTAGGESSGGSESGGGGESGGGSSGGESGGGSSGGGQSSQEFVSRETMMLVGGKFAGILDEKQSFALNILRNDIRLAVVSCRAEDKDYTLGLKNISGGIALKVINGVPQLELSFKAKAQIQSVREVLIPKETASDDVIEEPVLKAAEEEIKSRMESLVEACVEKDCDLFHAKDLLYKYNYKYFDAFKDDLLDRMKVNYKIEIKSVN